MPLYKNNDFDVERYQAILDAGASGMSQQEFEEKFAPVDDDDMRIYHWAATGDKLDLVDKDEIGGVPLFMRADLIRELEEDLTDEEEEELGLPFAPMMDEEDSEMEGASMGFMNRLVRELVDELDAEDSAENKD